MATRTGPTGGGLIGLLTGLLVVSGILGSRLYLPRFQEDQRALDAAVREDVEALRRKVLALDGQLEGVSDMYAAAGEAAQPEASAMRELLSANKALLREAQRIVRGELVGKSSGNSRATDHLGVNRIEGVLYLTEGKMHFGRAAFEQHLARSSWREAEERSVKIAGLRRQAARVVLHRPDAVLSAIAARGTQFEEDLSALRGQAAALEDLIATKTTRVDELESEAASTRRDLAELESLGLSEASDRSSYALASHSLREAEAEAAALRRGHLEGAEFVPAEQGDLLDASYEGGVPQPGIRDLSAALAVLKEREAALSKMKGDLADRRESLRQLADRLSSEEAEARAKAAALTEGVERSLVEAAGHADLAAEARQAAGSAFKLARNYASVAVRAAQNRTRDARAALTALPSGTDERLQRITQDGDTEGSLQCLHAEACYHAALTRVNMIHAARSRSEAEAFVSEMAGFATPSETDGATDNLREEALDLVTRSLDALDGARGSISKTSLRTADGKTISGKNYVWQVDVLEAAVHLLRAQLASDDTERDEAHDAAYQLLSEAAREREESPLLTPAVDTLLYLQQSARQ